MRAFLRAAVEGAVVIAVIWAAITALAVWAV